MSRIKDDPQKMWKRRIIDMELNYHARPIQKNVRLSRTRLTCELWSREENDTTLTTLTCKHESPEHPDAAAVVEEPQSQTRGGVVKSRAQILVQLKTSHV
ncbi:hypothetical protein TNCV_4988561 [Trichonephila clavipes]|nr:hypothetical protein TNCV_4988561 [Trichonephila clavipes]